MQSRRAESACHTSSTPLSWDTRSRGHRQAPVKRNAKPSVLCVKATSCLRSHLSQLPENHPKPYLPQLQSNILHSKPKTPTSRPEPPKPWWPPCLGLLEHGEGVREDLQRSSSPRKRSIGQDTGRPDTRQFESRREDDSMTGSLLLLRRLLLHTLRALPDRFGHLASRQVRHRSFLVMACQHIPNLAAAPRATGQ